MPQHLAADWFLGVFFMALGLFSFVWGMAQVLRHALLKARGGRTTATLTKIHRRDFGRSERYFATAEWRDEDGRPRTAKISSYGTYLQSHINKPLAGDEIYYNKRHVMLVNDKRNRLNAILMVPLGLLIIACGIGTLVEK
ncbi:MAG: DUF3592 domain-containing protein [Firmicutes bacterium]|nr:DUF3592 domain-containing protein [Bacillota bacterium]